MNFDVENENFDNNFFNPFDSQNILMMKIDTDLFSKKSEAVNSPYYYVDKFNSSSQNLKNSFFVLHINIRIMNKNFQKLYEYLSHIKGDMMQ